MVHAISGCVIVSWDGKKGDFQRKCNYCGHVVTHTDHGFSMNGTGTLNSGSHRCSKCGKTSDIKIEKSS